MGAKRPAARPVIAHLPAVGPSRSVYSGNIGRPPPTRPTARPTAPAGSAPRKAGPIPAPQAYANANANARFMRPTPAKVGQIGRPAPGGVFEAQRPAGPPRQITGGFSRRSFGIDAMKQTAAEAKAIYDRTRKPPTAQSSGRGGKRPMNARGPA